MSTKAWESSQSEKCSDEFFSDEEAGSKDKEKPEALSEGITDSLLFGSMPPSQAIFS